MAREVNRVKDKIRFIEDTPLDNLYMYNSQTGEYKPLEGYEADLIVRYNGMVLDALDSLVPK